jgi:hypothetical protein
MTQEQREARARIARSFREMGREVRNGRAGGRSIQGVLEAANACEQGADAYEFGFVYDYRGREFNHMAGRPTFYEDMK